MLGALSRCPVFHVFQASLTPFLSLQSSEAQRAPQHALNTGIPDKLGDLSGILSAKLFSPSLRSLSIAAPAKGEGGPRMTPVFHPASLTGLQQSATKLVVTHFPGLLSYLSLRDSGFCSAKR